MTKHDKPSEHAAKAKDASHDGHKHDHAEGDCYAATSIPALVKAPDELAGAKLTAQGMQTPSY